MIINTPKSIFFYLEKYFFKLWRVAFCGYYHIMRYRPTSYPYITGDAFRSLADHIFDEETTFDPSHVKTGDIVFVGSPKMIEYFSEIHPNIENKYILVQHNGDIEVDKKIASFIDDKIINFYAQIVLKRNPKIIPIPIGIENRHHGIEGFTFFLERKQSIYKIPKIFYHFNVATNPQQRIPALKYFDEHSLMDTIHSFVPYGSYKDILNKYMFTVSPPGNTLGSHRTWEALYARTIPIVKRTVDAEACVDLGMPIWIVDDWAELDDYCEISLSKRYHSMMRDARFDTVYMTYWKERIMHEKKVALLTFNSTVT